VEVVEDQLERRRARELDCESREHDGIDPWSRGRKLLEKLRVDPGESIERMRQIAQEHHRVVVAAIDVDPGHRPPTAGGPLRGEDRLAVARRRRDQNDRRVRCSRELPQQTLSLNHSDMWTGRSELRVADPWPRSRRARRSRLRLILSHLLHRTLTPSRAYSRADPQGDC
jgi:hypothetical protein